MRYEPGSVIPDSAVSRALTAAQDADYEGDARAAVLAFLGYMDEHYVGDYYVEGSLRHLLTMVRENRD